MLDDECGVFILTLDEIVLFFDAENIEASTRCRLCRVIGAKNNKIKLICCDNDELLLVTPTQIIDCGEECSFDECSSDHDEMDDDNVLSKVCNLCQLLFRCSTMPHCQGGD
jgi:hypothetical protein